MTNLDNLEFSSFPLAHLPLISEYIHRLGISKQVNLALPPDGRNKVSDAECVALMVLNILSGRVGLYQMGPWLETTDADVVLGKGCKPHHFSDSRMAGTLDRIYEYGLDNLLTDVVTAYLGRNEGDAYSVHHDTTALKLYGAFEVPDGQGPTPLHGFSKDHRPDLKQLVFGLSLHGNCGIPLCASMLDGNTSDKAVNQLHIERLAGLLPPQDDVTLVADCKLVDAETVGQVLKAGFHFISLLPRSFSLQAEMLKRALEEDEALPELYREKGRKKGASDRLYRGQSYQAEFRVLDPETAEIRMEEMRFLVVESPQLARKFEAGLAKRLERECKGLKKQLDKLGKLEFGCQLDAEKSYSAFAKKPRLHKVVVQYVTEEVKIKRAQRGRPKKGETQPTKHVVRICLQSLEVDEDAVEALRVKSRYFVLVTDHLDKQKWPDTKILKEYRHQYLVEGHTGFRWLKGPNMAAPALLNTPSRIAALGMVFVLALMVRNYIQGVARSALKELPKDVTFPNMDYRPTKSPTTENIFWMFRRVGTVIVSNKKGVELDRRLGGLDETCELALKLLQVPKTRFLETLNREFVPLRS